MEKPEFEFIDNCLLCQSNQFDNYDTMLSLKKCRKCQFVFMNPRPSYKSIQEFYSTYQKYDNWLDNLESREKMWKRRLSKILKLHKMGRLLDIGTGIGQFLAVARTYYPEACGTEISDSAIQIASNRYSLLVYRGTLETIKFKENSFDIITIFHVLEHLHQPNQAIQEIWRILKPEGILIIAVPNEIMSLKRIIKKYLDILVSNSIRIRDLVD